MRKYQRLVLLITSVLSLGLFLIYRHQYNRLHQVLEVFNFFGTPCNVSELERSPNLMLEHDWGPQPVWQAISTTSSAFTFSAFLLPNNLIKGILVQHPQSSLPRQCYLFLENGGIPVKGKLEAFSIQDESDYKVYLYSCTFESVKSLPYAVGFKVQGQAKYITVLVHNTVNSQLMFNSTLCVGPEMLSTKSLLEFISFHSMLGVESFIVYHHQDLPHRIVKLLRNFSTTLNIWITFYPVNSPYSQSFSSVALEYDCKLRTTGQTKYSLFLGVNDYVVPSADQALPHSNTAKIRLPVYKFCLNNLEQKKPMVLQNFELIDDYKFNLVLEVSKLQNTTWVGYTKLPSLFENNCVLHRYEKCSLVTKTKVDYSMKRFSGDLIRSTLVQLLIHDTF